MRAHICVITYRDFFVVVVVESQRTYSRASISGTSTHIRMKAIFSKFHSSNKKGIATRKKRVRSDNVNRQHPLPYILVMHDDYLILPYFNHTFIRLFTNVESLPFLSLRTQGTRLIIRRKTRLKMNRFSVFVAV